MFSYQRSLSIPHAGESEYDGPSQDDRNYYSGSYNGGSYNGGSYHDDKGRYLRYNQSQDTDYT